MLRPFRIYIDVDGVLAKCHEAAVNHFGISLTADNWPMGKWVQNIVSEKGVLTDEGWKLIDDREKFWAQFLYGFWANLPRHEWANDLVQYCQSIAGNNTFLMTKPVKTPHCYLGKAIWVSKHFPDMFGKNFILNRCKETCAPGGLLIDDSLTTCKKFRAEGGKAVLVRRPWNGHDNMTWDELRGEIATAIVS